MAGSNLLPLILFLSCLIWGDVVNATFTFEVSGQVAQCEPLSVSWEGGQPPFRLIALIPTITQFNITIPNENFQNNKGSFTLPALGIPANRQVFFAMSDATGPTSGGTTQIMTVGNAVNGKTCANQVLNNDFYFSADDTLTQCRGFLVNQYDKAQRPVTVFAWIPGGSDSFVVPIQPPDASSFSWTANVTAQSSVVLSMIDAQGRIGGADKVRIVAGSNDKSCITSKPGGGNSNNGDKDNSEKRKGGISTAVIIGIALGAALVIGILGALYYWLTKRNNRRYDGPRPLDLSEDPDYTSPPPASSTFPMLTPFTDEPASQGSGQPPVSEVRPMTTYLSPPPTSQGHTQYSESAGASSSSGAASNSRKLILHRDAEDVDEEPEDLPPQYVDRRPADVVASTSRPRKN